jgi:hypothetical protein
LDKDWTSATNYDELREMASRDFSADRIFIQKIKSGDVGRSFGGPKRVQGGPDSPPKKRQKEMKILAPRETSSSSQGIRTGPLNGVKIYVLNGERVTEVASELGAELVSQYTSGCIPVAERDDIRVKSFVNIHEQSVLGLDWLEDCRDAYTIVPIDSEIHVIHVQSEISRRVQ